MPLTAHRLCTVEPTVHHAPESVLSLPWQNRVNSSIYKSAAINTSNVAQEI
jgi:hypothetical protein